MFVQNAIQMIDLSHAVLLSARRAEFRSTGRGPTSANQRHAAEVH